MWDEIIPRVKNNFGVRGTKGFRWDFLERPLCYKNCSYLTTWDFTVFFSNTTISTLVRYISEWLLKTGTQCLEKKYHKDQKKCVIFFFLSMVYKAATVTRKSCLKTERNWIIWFTGRLYLLPWSVGETDSLTHNMAYSTTTSNNVFESWV